jgi:hypothetical protein
MKGNYKIIVRNSKVQFTLEIERNITIISGQSGTGKTTLIGLLQDYEQLGKQSGVSVQCARPCVVVGGNQWQLLLEHTENSIVFIDEGNAFLRSKEFAEIVTHSSNYFVLITRESLPQLSYSVGSILKMEQTGKQNKITYNQTYPLYDSIPELNKQSIGQYTFLTEDSKAGFQMYSSIAGLKGTTCISACGKSNIASLLTDREEQKILVIADGAAFGSEMEKVYQMILDRPEMIRLYLPESFEWLVLRSGIVTSPDLADILNAPYDYIVSEDYASWERFFTHLLETITRETPLQYDKNKLASPYLLEENVHKIMDTMIG